MFTNILWKPKAKEQRNKREKHKKKLMMTIDILFQKFWHQKRFVDKTKKILLQKQFKSMTPWSQTPKQYLEVIWWCDQIEQKRLLHDIAPTLIYDIDFWNIYDRRKNMKKYYNL
jgi:hypothetical protein